MKSCEKLSGTIERITYHNPDNGFCVLRVKIKSQYDLMTVIGNCSHALPGAYITCEGFWVNDKKHGLQFQANQIQITLPNTLNGIERYLGSGLIKGIGRHFARLLVKAFGDQVFEVIQSHPERLASVSGIGKKRKEQIITAWKTQKVIREIMVFLQSYGVSTARAVKIYKTYGENAIQLVTENPYRLALDIWGIGFKSSDELAKKLGISPTSLIRAQAGVHHVLLESSQLGHCCLEYEFLVQQSSQLLEIPEGTIREAIEKEVLTEKLIQEVFGQITYIFLPSLYQAEKMVTEKLLRLQKGTVPWGNVDAEKAIPWVEEITRLQLSESQKKAIYSALKEKVLIITGGPGVGKTTIVNSILKILLAKKLKVMLCAPTGRAAKRLTETTRVEAKTIHRLLGFKPGTYHLEYSEYHPLPVDFVVVDEVSMIDVLLMSQLLKAIPTHAALLLVGDVDQLPSVGPGTVLSDMIESQVIPTICLTEIFRQAAHSQIILNAHRVNRGEFLLQQDLGQKSDFYFIPMEDPEAIYEKILQSVSQGIPDRYHVNPIRDIQVLTPMKIGKLGSHSLNNALQSLLNAQSEPKISRFGFTFSPGDKVIQNVNNYDKDVFNGDIGVIDQVKLEDSTVLVRFEQGLVEYDFNELDEISLAYAMTIHKSQGSEYPIVVIPMTTQHYVMLARNLLYTGMTRGKKLVVLIGQKKAIAIAIKNKQFGSRKTQLKSRLTIPIRKMCYTSHKQ